MKKLYEKSELTFALEKLVWDDLKFFEKIQ